MFVAALLATAPALATVPLLGVEGSWRPVAERRAERDVVRQRHGDRLDASSYRFSLQVRERAIQIALGRCFEGDD
jgi:hypothetical protein